MVMILNEEQRMLAESVAPFLASRAPVSHLRTLRDSGRPEGFDPDLWRSFADMGLCGILVSEEFGGAALGQVEAGLVLAEIGRNLTPSPFLMTAVGAATALNHASSELKHSWLPHIASGGLVATLALEESPRHRPDRIDLAARRDGSDFLLSGSKRFVVHADSADLTIVVARTSGRSCDEHGLTLFAITGNNPDVQVESERLVDSSVAATMTFRDARVSASHVIGGVDQGAPVLECLLACLRVGAAAELVGLGSRAFAMTLSYLRERNQFGRPIGSFQALQHRAAHLYTELEIAGAAVLKAQQLIDAGHPGARSAAMVAKAAAGLASALAVQEAVQMHGGIGMTDEFDIGFYMKRQRVLAEMFGDTDYHVDRLARDAGY